MTSKSGAMDNFVNIINAIGKLQIEFDSIKSNQNLNQKGFRDIDEKDKYYINYLEQAESYLNSGNYKEAILCFKKELEQNSCSSECHFKLGHAYLKNEDYYDSIDSMNIALKIGLSEIKKAGAFTALSSAYVGLKDYDRAIENLLKVIELLPNVPYLYNTLGTLYEAKGDRKRAEEYYHFSNWLADSDNK